jgi:rhodanese-related sulfurtransferase
MKTSFEEFITEKKDENHSKKDVINSALKKFVKKTKSDWNYITPEELYKEDFSKFFLLDIRKKEDFEEGHIKGAKNIFWMDLLKEKNLEKLPKDKKIVLICYVGHTASQMMVALKLLGYDAMTLKFGMGKSPVEGVPVAGWLDFGYDVVKNKD